MLGTWSTFSLNCFENKNVVLKRKETNYVVVLDTGLEYYYSDKYAINRSSYVMLGDMS